MRSGKTQARSARVRSGECSTCCRRWRRGKRATQAVHNKNVISLAFRLKIAAGPRTRRRMCPVICATRPWEPRLPRLRRSRPTHARTERQATTPRRGSPPSSRGARRRRRRRRARAPRVPPARCGPRRRGRRRRGPRGVYRLRLGLDGVLEASATCPGVEGGGRGARAEADLESYPPE